MDEQEHRYTLADLNQLPTLRPEEKHWTFKVFDNREGDMREIQPQWVPKPGILGWLGRLIPLRCFRRQVFIFPTKELVSHGQD